MKIVVLAHTLDDRTGTGEFVSSMINHTQDSVPDTSFSVMTSEDLLAPSYICVLKNWSAIREKLRNADVVHAIDAYPYGAIAALANIRIGRPLVITTVGTGSTQLFERFTWKAWLLRWAYAQADHITAISEYVARKIESHVREVKVEVVNPGINCEYWEQTSSLPIDKELRNVEPYILSVGEFKSRKGYDVILPIMKEVLVANPTAKYVIVANMEKNHEYRERLMKQIQELGIEDRVVILSRLSRDELRNAYQRASLYLTLPQESKGDVEGFGMAILQAAACGVPAVVGRGSGADDAVLDRVSGFLVSSADPNEVAEKANELLKNVSLHGELSKGARNLAKSLTWQNQVGPYAAIYRKFIK